MALAVLLLALLLAPAAHAQTPGAASAMSSETHRAVGHFDVQMKRGAGPSEAIARFAMTKTFHGDLEGSSTGEMLSAGDPRTGAAGYVAIEQVTGEIGGRSGGFALAQYGLMNAGEQQLKVVIVPGSGVGAFKGVTGDMTIDPGAGHAYVLTYRLPR